MEKLEERFYISFILKLVLGIGVEQVFSKPRALGLILRT